jgi:hypothetical protein
MKLLAAFLAACLAFASPAFANFNVTVGSGTTIFAIDGANQGSSGCAAASTECYANVIINAAGLPIGVSGAPLYVTGSGGTFPVTGTFWQATQPVSGTFWQTTQPVSGTFWQTTQPVSGTFWQTTQPISAASLPLPTGAATSGTIGSAVPSTGIYAAGAARSSEPSAATTGNLTGRMLDLVGKTVTSPYANRENMVRGSNTSTGTSAVTILSAGGASVKTYVTDVECGRTDAGTSPILVTFNDSASTPLVVPNAGSGGGHDKTFNVPLVTAANTAFTFTPSSATTTVYCAAQGFEGY